MNAITPALLFCAGILVNTLLVYISYLCVARKECTHGSMLKAASVVAAVAAIVAALSWWLSEYVPAGYDLITAVLLTYHCGRFMLKINLKKAIAAACVFFGIILTLGIAAGLTMAACMH